MRFRFWPRTLVVQLVLITAAAVAVSNIGVAIYFYKNSEAQTRNFNTERMIDRTAAVAATVRQVPQSSRLVVMQNMSRVEWRFREAKGYVSRPMTAEETALARRLADALPQGVLQMPGLARIADMYLLPAAEFLLDARQIITVAFHH